MWAGARTLGRLCRVSNRKRGPVGPNGWEGLKGEIRSPGVSAGSRDQASATPAGPAPLLRSDV